MDKVTGFNDEQNFMVFGLANHDIANYMIDVAEENFFKYTTLNNRIFIDLSNDHVRKTVSLNLDIKLVERRSRRSETLPRGAFREYQAYLKSIIDFLQNELITSNVLQFRSQTISRVTMKESELMQKSLDRELRVHREIEIMMNEY